MCSTLVDDNALFCSSCGSNQFVTEAGATPTPQQDYSQVNQQQAYYQQPHNNVPNQQFAPVQNNAPYPQFNQQQNVMGNTQYQQPYQNQPFQNIVQPGFVNNQMNIPHNATFKDFIEKFATEKHRKNVKTSIIVYYVCAGLTALLAFASAGIAGGFPWGIIDAVVLGLLTLGLQKTKKKAFVIAILILGIIEFVVGIALTGTPSAVLWVIISACLLNTYKEVDKEYKQFKNSLGFNSAFNNGMQ